MLTDEPVCRRRHTSPRAISQSDVQLYRDLAQASGGQTVEVMKSALPQIMTVIKDSSWALVRRQTLI